MTERAASLTRRLRVVAIGAGLVAAAALAGCAGGIAEGLSGSAEKAPDLAELSKPGPLGDKALGQSGAPVVIVEYASLGCPICGVFHQKVMPQIRKAYIETGKVYWIYREFPIGNSSTAAAQAARCVDEKQYFRMNDRFMATKGQWNGREPDLNALYKIVQDTGLSRTEFDSCMANQNIKDGLVRVKQRGREFGVKGTPTFFINGQHVRGVLSYEEMRKLIDQHLQSAAKPA